MTAENIVNIAKNHNHHHQHQHQRQHRHQHHRRRQQRQQPHQPRRQRQPRQQQQHLPHRKWSHVSVVPVRWLAFWVCVVCLLNVALPEVIYRVDPLALLAATLRTYQRAGCDSEQLSLSCPRGTSISIELAQYGRAGDLSDHSLCPPVSHEDLTTTGSAGDGVVHSRTEIEVKPPETCTVSGLQYALLQTVVDACQKKRHCKFSANPKALSSVDPCSGIRKFVEIAYKCRPYEFRSKVACENDNMPLVCNPYSRIAIYSASFGHIERESVQCGHGSVPDNAEAGGGSSKQTCLVSYATETVMQICHGRRRCSITADAGTFGRPCKHDVRMYLKVVYTCIPRKVLKDRYETAPEADEPQQSELDLDQDDLYDEDQFYKESEAIPPAPKLQGAIPNPAFPFDFSLGADDTSTTSKPPYLSRNSNNNSLEDRLQSSAAVWLHNRKEELLNQTRTGLSSYSDADFAPGYATAAVETSTVTPSTSTSDSQVTGTPGGSRASTATWRNFFYKRKCQMEDDWGHIGLNCTDADFGTERVEVVGFLANWMQAYTYIRKNQEQFYLYLIISVAAGVLLCLTLVVGRLALQRQRTCRKNSSSSGSNNAKNCSETSGGAGVEDGNEKYHQTVTGETHLPNSFGDDISDIDADMDLTSPMPLPSLSSRNETYTAYAPTPNCTYASLPPPTSSASLASAAATMLMPASHQPGLLMTGHASMKSLGGSANSNSRQPTPPPQLGLYTSQGVCSPTVSGPISIGPHVLTPTALNTVPHHSASYLAGALMMPSSHHHTHTGALRRSMIPTSMGIMGTQPSSSAGTGPSHGIAGIPAASGIYYDSTMPRNLNRGMSADSTQYFYG